MSEAKLQTGAVVQATLVPVQVSVGPGLSELPEVLPRGAQVHVLRESGTGSHLC